MRLTSRSEYALLALIHLGRHDTGRYATTEAIASAQDIPLAFLEQILLALKRARFVVSAKGQHGGFRLARPPAQISLAEVIRLFDGALAPTCSVSEYYYAATPVEREPKLLSLFREIRDYVARTLEETTLADVL